MYYHYTMKQGTNSSAGIQSLLNNPLSHTSVPAAGMTPSSGTSTVPPFKFRHRGEKVDWRQINKVDINLVKSQLDIDTLQAHINEVTLCSLDGERCQECRSPVDPGLLKLLQLGQLSVEWLLHCQEVLSLNQHAAEERLEAARMEQKQLLEQQSQQEEKVKALNEELMLKGKVVSDLQSQLLLCSHKCKVCKKGFLTPQFLQSHIQRRHPEDHESQLQSDREIKPQIDILKTEISGLKEMNVQLQQNLQLKTAQVRKAEHRRTSYEQICCYVEKRLESEREQLKAEEMVRFERIQADSAQSQAKLLLNLEQQLKKQEELWQSKLQQTKDHHKSEMNKLLDELSRVRSSVSAEQERSQQLKQEMEQLKQEMELRLQEMQLSIEALRKQEMEQRQEMQLSIEAQRKQEMEPRLQEMQLSIETLRKQEMEQRLQEMQLSIEAQRKQEMEQRQEMQLSIEAQMKQEMEQRQEMQQSIEAQRKQEMEQRQEMQLSIEAQMKQDMEQRQEMQQSIEALREQVKNNKVKVPVVVRAQAPEPQPKRVGLDSSSASEPEQSPSVTVNARKRRPSTKKKMRRKLKRAVSKSLEDLGVKPNQSGVKNREFTSIMAKVHSGQDQAAKEMPGYGRCRGELDRSLNEKSARMKREAPPETRALSRNAVQGRQSKTPQPAPRARSTTPPKKSTPDNSAAPRTCKLM
ncbi:cilium assembly protein DZIP1-like [Platichthys flesus]|uniref:cilium assembly protein DZIP1-like n=1 Tax=Platichthys flesus TaxID=8260 RepID=UPI002DBE4AF6|nr:cilium assembly protein DZIP1-like [Platichthys flesus]